MNTRFTELALALPALRDIKKPSKSQIVCKSLEYIQLLTARQTRRDRVLEQLFEEHMAVRDQLDGYRRRAGEEPLPPSQAHVSLQQMMQEEEAEEQLEQLQQQQMEQQQQQSQPPSGGGGGRSSTPALLTVPQPTPPLTPLPASRKSNNNNAENTNRIAIPVYPGSPRGSTANSVAFSPASSTASFHHPQSFHQTPQLRVQIPMQQQQLQMLQQQQQQQFGWLPGSGVIPLSDVQQFALAQSCPSQFSMGMTGSSINNNAINNARSSAAAMYTQNGFAVPAAVDMNDVNLQINQVLNGVDGNGMLNATGMLDQAFLMDEDFEGSADFKNLHVTPVTPVDPTEQAIMDDLVFLE